MISAKFTRVLLPLAGLLTVAGFGIAAAQTPPPAPTPAAPGKPMREKHPELRAAMRALQNAKKALANSAHDYDGHRAKAAQLTDEAIEEVKAAFASDKN